MQHIHITHLHRRKKKSRKLWNRTAYSSLVTLHFYTKLHDSYITQIRIILAAMHNEHRMVQLKIKTSTSEQFRREYNLVIDMQWQTRNTRKSTSRAEIWSTSRPRATYTYTYRSELFSSMDRLLNRRPVQPVSNGWCYRHG